MGATLILQELCRRSVEDCMQDGKVLYAADGSPDQVAVIRMLIDAALGLDYLSCSGIVHGDVKAANVLLCTTGGNKRGWQAKIADLGLSRMLPPNATSIPALAECGTLASMAPETFAGRVTLAADVYSFAILMFEVWTRRRAWPNMIPAQVVFAVATQHKRPVIPRSCPKDYATLVQQCWAQEPEDRPSFQEVLKALRAILKRLLAAGAPDNDGRKTFMTRRPMSGSML